MLNCIAHFDAHSSIFQNVPRPPTLVADKTPKPTIGTENVLQDSQKLLSEIHQLVGSSGDDQMSTSDKAPPTTEETTNKDTDTETTENKPQIELIPIDHYDEHGQPISDIEDHEQRYLNSQLNHFV